MDSSYQVNAAHYQAEARRIRRKAATVKDEAIRSQLLEIVTTYEQLAERIEKKPVDAAYDWRAVPIFRNADYAESGGPALAPGLNRGCAY